MPLLAVRPQCWQRIGSPLLLRGAAGTEAGVAELLAGLVLALTEAVLGWLILGGWAAGTACCTRTR